VSHKEQTVSKIEPVAPEQDPRPLNDVELDTVSGGFGFVERGIIINGGKQYDPVTGTFFLRNANAN
jgi:hypothetical protein